MRLVLSRSLSPPYFIFSFPCFLFFPFAHTGKVEKYGGSAPPVVHTEKTSLRRLFSYLSFSIHGLSCYTHTTTPFLAGEDGLGKSKYCIGSYTSTENDLGEGERKKKVKPRSVHRLESTTTITKTRNKSHDSDRKGRRINI